MGKYWKHFKYTMIHKYWVARYCFEIGLYWQGITHDWNKFLPSQFFAYAGNFFDDHKKYKSAFAYAWLEHQNRNKHHWHYWLSVNFEGEIKPLEMPNEYIGEMVADWRAAGKAKGTSDGSYAETARYYEENEDRMILHPMTKKTVEFILWLGKKNEN